ncbi:MAG: phage holin family protein [Myxococcales bacterium]|nr:phage holin family protein [Myxococcales bacterium]
MMSLLLSFVLYALAFMLTAKMVPGIEVRSFRSAVGFAIIFAVLDGLLFKLLAFLTLPLVIASLGLFLLVIRAWLFMLTDKFIDGVKIEGFVSALVGSLMTAILNSGITWLVHKLF